MRTSLDGNVTSLSCKACRPAPLADRERLELLAATGLLDSPEEDAFSRLTRLTSEILSLPIALVSLVDSRRQYFAAQVGLPEPYASARETPLSLSWCQYVVTDGQPLIFSDSAEDPRFRDSLPATQLGLRAYAGFPIVCDGAILGSFCAIHLVPHRWTDLELRTIREFADSVASELELRLELERRKRAENELLRSNEELNQFAHIASHDLKEPLRGVSGCLQLLKLDLEDLDPSAAELLDHAVQSADRMQQMVQSLYHYSQLGSNSLRIAAVDLDLLVAEAASDLRAVLAERGAELRKVGPLGVVRGDRAQLGQLIQNLVLNGVKFSKPEGAPIVEVGRREDGALYVRDNGIGMAPAHHKKVFEVFSRLHRGGEYQGTGMGLAVTRRIVQRHGGEIWVDSALGEGSTFLFTLGVQDEK